MGTIQIVTNAGLYKKRYPAGAERPMLDEGKHAQPPNTMSSWSHNFDAVHMSASHLRKEFMLSTAPLSNSVQPHYEFLVFSRLSSPNVKALWAPSSPSLLLLLSRPLYVRLVAFPRGSSIQQAPQLVYQNLQHLTPARHHPFEMLPTGQQIRSPCLFR